MLMLHLVPAAQAALLLLLLARQLVVSNWSGLSHGWHSTPCHWQGQTIAPSQLAKLVLLDSMQRAVRHRWVVVPKMSDLLPCSNSKVCRWLDQTFAPNLPVMLLPDSLVVLLLVLLLLLAAQVSPRLVASN